MDRNLQDIPYAIPRHEPEGEKIKNHKEDGKETDWGRSLIVGLEPTKEQSEPFGWNADNMVQFQ